MAWDARLITSSLDSESTPREPPPRDQRSPEAIGRFTVKATLGRGGQGTVYLAIDPVLGRSVAIKVRHQPEPMRAQHEATAAAKLAHPNVVQVFDSGWTFDGRPFVVMQYLPGGSLTRWTAAEPRSVDALVQRFLEVGEGLAAIHQHRLLHCDVKPDNVIIKEDGSAALSDFGLARSALDGASRSGTAGFMAPELLATGRATEHTDQYAFCVSLYLSLTGQYPEPVVERLKLPPGQTLAPWLRDVVERGLRAEPQRRFSSMRELLTALRKNPRERRKRVLTQTLVASLLVVASISSTAWLLRETPEDRAVRLCTERTAALHDELWSPQLVERVRQHFTDVGGNAAFTAVSAHLENEVKALVVASRSACLVRDAVERRNTDACLLARKAVLRTTGDFLASLERHEVPQVLRMLAFELKPVEACRSTQAVPTSLHETDADRELLVELAPVALLRSAQRFDEARRLAVEVLARADVANADWARAEALLAAGLALADQHDSTAIERLQSAVTAAERVAADEVRARAWIGMMSVHVYRHEFPLANLAASNAEAIVTRLGSPNLLAAPLLNAEGNRLYALGDLREANEKFRAYRALLLETRSVDDPLVKRADANVLLSEESDEARVAGFLVLVREARAELGDDHPETWRLRANLVSAWLGAQRCDEARGEAAALVASSEREPVLRAGLGDALFLHARALHCLGETAPACTTQLRGLEALRTASPPDGVLRDEVDFAIGLCPERRAALILENCTLGFPSPDPAVPCPD